MSRKWLFLVVALALAAAPGGGKYVGMTVLTLLAPVYAILLASISFIVFLITAAIAVPIGQTVLDSIDVRAEMEGTVEERREAA